jgi:carboxylate-amine ligase
VDPPATQFRYRARAGDEAIGRGAVPRPDYREIVGALLALGPDGLEERARSRDEELARQGLVFGVGDRQQPFHVDLVPRVIGPHEWEELEVGLTQRAWAIESFLRDVYGPQAILDEGVLPRDVVVGSPGWRDEARRLPAGAVRAPVMGFDLVRNEYGGWRVLEDNVRCPSGLAYAVAVRQLLDTVMPDLPRPDGLAHPAAGYELLRTTLLSQAEPGTRAALLSPGAGGSAWFEHCRLAEGAGLLLTTADDLDVVGGRVVRRTGGETIGVLYLRLDDELPDLVDGTGRRIGAEILDVAAEGRVALANAPGNGVADDKSTYPFVPELITYYLGERPALESVPTYRPVEPSERLAVLERVGELVTKPVDGYGGAGVLIGPAATAAEVARRRAEIALRPADWVAQEVVALSSLPCSDGGRLEPRHVDLRAFVYLTGPDRDDARLAPLGLTRVAPPGSLIVNSSRGGGAKDTWIVPRTREGGQPRVRTGR